MLFNWVSNEKSTKAKVATLDSSTLCSATAHPPGVLFQPNLCGGDLATLWHPRVFWGGNSGSHAIAYISIYTTKSFINAIFTKYVPLRYRWNITLKKCQSFQVNERETLKEVSFWENPSWQPFQSNIPLRSIIIPQTKSIWRKLTPRRGPQGISLNIRWKIYQESK